MMVTAGRVSPGETTNSLICKPPPPPHQRQTPPPTMNCARSLATHSIRPTISYSGPTVLSRGLRAQAGAQAGATTEGGARTSEKLRTIESMPFQTYQLALDVIRKDRAEKMEAVVYQRKKIANIVARSGGTPNEHRK